MLDTKPFEVGIDFTTSSMRSLDNTSKSLNSLVKQSDSRVSSEDREEIIENLMKPLDECLKLVKVGEIKAKVQELTKGVESFLIRDRLFADVVNQVLNEINNLPALSGLKYWVRIFISKDMEIPDWEEVVISVGIKNKSFDETMEIWEEIEKKVEKVINRIKATIPSRKIYEDKSLITKIDEKLAIEVKRI